MKKTYRVYSTLLGKTVCEDVFTNKAAALKFAKAYLRRWWHPMAIVLKDEEQMKWADAYGQGVHISIYWQ